MLQNNFGFKIYSEKYQILNFKTYSLKKITRQQYSGVTIIQLLAVTHYQ